MKDDYSPHVDRAARTLHKKPFVVGKHPWGSNITRGVKIRLHGIPIAQQRPRATRRGANVIIYEPKESKQWKKDARKQIGIALASAQHKPFSGAVILRLEFYLPRPKSLKKSTVHHIKKPDLDNLIKIVMDACSGLVYHDDNQVSRLTCGKQYASDHVHFADGTYTEGVKIECYELPVQ